MFTSIKTIAINVFRAAIKRLQKHKNGFFLMVEGGLIDVAHHKNNAKRALEETLEFERAVKVNQV